MIEILEIQVDEGNIAFGTHKKRIISILEGKFRHKINSLFTKVANHGDMELVRQTKASINKKKSVIHGGVLLYNGLTFAGTTNDNFMREYYKWISMATHWSNFNATASFGMVHLVRIYLLND